MLEFFGASWVYLGSLYEKRLPKSLKKRLRWAPRPRLGATISNGMLLVERYLNFHTNLELDRALTVGVWEGNGVSSLEPRVAQRGSRPSYFDKTQFVRAKTIFAMKLKLQGYNPRLL